jgi:4-hydroxybenzoate polyprenyltransferase
MPQAWLGLAFGFGIPMAYAAQLGNAPPLAWALVTANVFWTIAYDTEYAMVDRDDDIKLGLRTSAILFGRHDVAAVMGFHALFIITMLAIGAWQRFGVFYHAGVAVAAALALWQYRLIRDRTREGCFKAFLHNNWIGAAIFAGIALDNVPWTRLLGR